MNCLECQDLLQQRLDGDAKAGGAKADAALEQHLQQCSACREQHTAAVRLLDGLKAMPKPALGPDFASMMTGRVLKDRRHRHEKMQRGLLVTVALAASVVLMLVIAYYWIPRTPTNEPQRQDMAEGNKEEPKDPPKKETPAPRKEEPRNPLAELPDRMAETTRDHAKVVLAAASIDGIEKLPMQQLPAIDPGGVREAGQEVSDGVRVVSRNTRRAFDFFARELPMPSLVSNVEPR